VGGLGADATLTLEVLRQGETIEVAVPAMDFISGGIMAQFDMGGHGMGLLPFEQMVPGQGMPFGGMMGRGQGMNGRLGLAFVTLDETVAAENNVTLTDGALVVEVEADSPAAEAGLQANDVIVAVNGEPVDAERTLRDRLVAYEAGDTITLTINRGGEEQQIDVTLGEPVQMGMGQMFQIPVMPGMDGHGFGFGGGMGNGQGLPPGHPAVPGMPAPEATPEASGNPA
jgi:membrane-associated protease RseP (regulator of RpoE activity)